jgi:hypothetical protein
MHAMPNAPMPSSDAIGDIVLVAIDGNACLAR